VDPGKTLFRVASVSKVFNAMAALKLVDQNIIDPAEDVRPRLAAAGLELDGSDMGPITLKQLMTHSAGIRELYIPDVTVTKDRAHVLPLGPYLQKCLPLRWQNSGETMLYTDHGVSLAGYVIEVVSRTQFQEQVRSTILRPLGMRSTCYTVTHKQRPDVAVAYSYVDSAYKPMEFRYTSIDPAAGVLTTGSDMARLMRAHLSGGKKWVSAQTLKLMHEPQYSDDPRLGLWFTCGFWRMLNARSEPYLFHYGGAFGFAAQVTILPNSDLGFFVAQSRDAQLAFELGDLEEILEWKSAATNAAPAEPPKRIASDAEQIKSLAGTYVCGRDLSRGRSIATNQHIYVRYLKELNGIEVMHARHKNRPLRMVEVEPLYFCAIDGNQHASFRPSRDGKRMFLFDLNFTGDVQFTRISEKDLAAETQR
jgi:CubicO group peptidase (beta-lactamase class C family)